MRQKNMALLGETEPMEMLPEKLIQGCKNRHEAIQLCVAWSRKKSGFIADMLGIDRGQFTRMMGGTAHFPDRKDDDLMQVCRNYAPMQYSAMRWGFDLQERSKDARIRELQAQLAALQSDDMDGVAA